MKVLLVQIPLLQVLKLVTMEFVGVYSDCVCASVNVMSHTL